MTVCELISTMPKNAWNGIDANSSPSRPSGGSRLGAGSMPITGQ